MLMNACNNFHIIIHSLLHTNIDSEINEEADEGDATPGKKWQEYFSNDGPVEDNCDEVS